MDFEITRTCLPVGWSM